MADAGLVAALDLNSRLFANASERSRADAASGRRKWRPQCCETRECSYRPAVQDAALVARNSGHEAEVVIAVALLVAERTPAADVAVLDGLGISLSRRLNRSLIIAADLTVVGGV